MAKKHDRDSATGTVAEQFREMRKGWADTEARTGSGGFPEGKNQEGIIKEVVIELSPKKGQPQVHWTLVGTSKDIEGQTDHKWSSMATPENRQWLKGEMETIDLVWPPTPEELGDALGAAQDLKIRFDVKDTKKDEYDNHNIYFREALESPSGGTPAAETPSGGSPTTPSKKEIRQLGKDEDEAGLQAIIDEEALDIDQDKINTYPEVAVEIIKQLAD